MAFWRAYPSLGETYAWHDTVLWLNVFADAVIGLSLLVVTTALLIFARKQTKTQFTAAIALAALLVCAAATQVINVGTTWFGFYGHYGIAKAIAAGIALICTMMLLRYLPRQSELKNINNLRADLRLEILQQKRRSTSLRHTEKRFKTFLQHAPNGMLIADRLTGSIYYSNDMAHTIFGYKPGELTRRLVTDLIPKRLRHLISPTHNELFDTQKALDGDPKSGADFICMRKDESEFPTDIRISNITSNNKDVFVITFQDITARKDYEEQARQEFMAASHVSRLSTVGQMATGLAHELNQPLTAISNNLYTAMLIQRQKKNPDPVLLELMEENYQSAQHAGQIIQSLRQLVRKDLGPKKLVNINDLVESTLKLIKPEALASDIKIKLALEPSLPETVMDPVQIQQVIINLARNAVEAFTGQTHCADSPCLLVRTQLDEPSKIRVSVLDNGPGLSANIKANLFQAFRSSKKEGMGLGLSICRSIIESHGGDLWHEDDANHGTKFNFSLPIIVETNDG